MKMLCRVVKETFLIQRLMKESVIAMRKTHILIHFSPIISKILSFIRQPDFLHPNYGKLIRFLR